MSLPVAAGYGCLVLIWSTVPLAVKWAVMGFGYEYASVLRFSIALPVLVLWWLLRRTPVPCSSAALATYGLAAVNFYTFVAIFWGAQFVPSGWLGLVWGVSPFVTAVLSLLLLGERALGPRRLAGLALGLGGMALIFGEAVAIGPQAVQGLAAMLTGVVISSFTSVGIKRIGADVPPFAVTLMAVGIALPAYALSWWLAGAPVATAPDGRALLAIVYVGIFGTAVVFTLLYYVLRHVRATQVSLIGMLAPVLAVVLGNVLNDEVVGPRIWAGTAVVLMALLLHEYLPRREGAGLAGRRVRCQGNCPNADKFHQR